jgi:hypothetical protein
MKETNRRNKATPKTSNNGSGPPCTETFAFMALRKTNSGPREIIAANTLSAINHLTCFFVTIASFNPRMKWNNIEN